MKQKIDSITIGIAVKNITESLAWYKQLLGDVEILEPAQGTVELKLAENAWLQIDDTGYLEVGGRSTIIRLETKDIDAAFLQVNKLTSDVDKIETVKGAVKYFDFRDLSGNRLSYYQLI